MRPVFPRKILPPLGWPGSIAVGKLEDGQVATLLTWSTSGGHLLASSTGFLGLGPIEWGERKGGLPHRRGLKHWKLS
jgi:hypothetical protein